MSFAAVRGLLARRGKASPATAEQQAAGQVQEEVVAQAVAEAESPEIPLWRRDEGVWPFITVVMPVRNEEQFIAATLEQLLAQRYPHDRFEIIVADGMSDDATPDIVKEIAGRAPQVRYVPNAGRRSSAGRNAGFREGRGDIFLVVDGHCHIPDAMLLHNVAQCMRRFDADCLGRPQPLDPPGLTAFQRVVALARASRIGHGAGSLIYSGYEGPASPVSNGAAYTRAVLEKVGYVDESFDACEDVEFNYRVEQAGFTAATSPLLTVRYYPRETLPELWRQMVRYGEGRFRLWRRHPATLTLPAALPAALAAGVFSLPLCLLAALAGWLLPLGMWLLCVLLYALAVFTVSAVEAQKREEPALLRHMPVVFGSIHLGLGYGFLRAAARCLRQGWRQWKNSFIAVLPRRARRVLGIAERVPHSGGPVRVGMVIDGIWSPTAGTEKQLLMLLDRLDREKFEPVLYVLRGSQWISESFDSCQVRVAGTDSFKTREGWRGVLRLAQWFAADGVDVVQLHFRDATLAGTVAAWLAGVPRVISMRKNQGYWLTRPDRLLLRVLNRGADVFVANSADTAARVRRTEHLPAEAVRVIPNGFDTSALPGDGGMRAAARQEAREALGLAPDVPVAGIVANLRPVKRLDVFLKAAAAVRRKMPAAHFVLVGEGSARPALEKQARKLKLEECTVFAGRREDVQRLLPAFDVGVLSSDSESFSNALVEYMAAGLPVAATDVGGVREALEGSAAGRIVPAGNARRLGAAVLELLQDEQARGLAAEEHPRIVRERFSARAYVAAYEELYRELMCGAADVNASGVQKEE
jgi:glycosyltransferase involved in cell wall biosynthesis/GT2 family glycosyltransferase